MTVNCAAHPSRIDFSLMPPSSDRPFQAKSLPTIEDAKIFREELSLIIDRIGKGVPSGPISRVACIFQFVAVQPSVEEANAAILSIMPPRYRIKLTNEEEFIFQINEPKNSQGVEHFRLNYITKWSVERFQLLSLQLPSAGMSPVSMIAGVLPFSATTQLLVASVVFDNNTIPSNQEMPASQQTELLREAFVAAEKSQNNINIKIAGA